MTSYTLISCVLQHGCLHTDEPCPQKLPGSPSPLVCNSLHTDTSVCPRRPQLAYEHSKLWEKRSNFGDVSSVFHCSLLRVSVVAFVPGEEWKMDHHTCALIHFYFLHHSSACVIYSSLASSTLQEKVIQIINFDGRYMIEADILFQFFVLNKNISIFSTAEAVKWVLLLLFMLFQAMCGIEKWFIWLDDNKYYGGDGIGC